MFKNFFITLALLSFISCASNQSALSGPTYPFSLKEDNESQSYTVANLPIQKELPDPLALKYGQTVKMPEQWYSIRESIKLSILEYEYGDTPNNTRSKSSENLKVHNAVPTHERTSSALTPDRHSQLIKYTLSFGDDDKLSTTLHVYIPKTKERKRPFILRFGLGSEHALAAIQRGYVFACFEQTSLDPDTEGHDIIGPAQEMYPDATWGSLAVWAWGASRVMDFLETREYLDTNRSVITGHSRTGKAALLAGALDERFAIVVPNGSGAGGAATFRGAGKGNETLDLITRESRFKSWFHKDFGQFAYRADRLPFDQHYMRALVAPRVILSTDAYGDKWAHPEGVQKAWEGAQPVFDLLGVPENNLIHFRGGGHDQLATDFEVLLDVADAHFNGKPFPESLRTAPFPK